VNIRFTPFLYYNNNNNNYYYYYYYYYTTTKLRPQCEYQLIFL